MHNLGLDYFHAFEDDLEHLSRYVEFSPDNYATYSLELVRLLLAAGSEVDVALKALCAKTEPRRKPKNISDYKKILLPKFKEITSQPVKIRKFGITVVPWEGWDTKSPQWWQAYNHVKHSRLSNYRLGNLENVLHAVAGLGVVMQFAAHSSAENFRGYFFSGLHLRGFGPR